jgi:hypothetical protein
MRLIEVLDFGSEELTGYSSNPEFESLLFLEEATGKTKEKIYVDKEKIGKKDFIRFKNYLKRRVSGEPWQYNRIHGFSWFSDIYR